MANQKTTDLTADATPTGDDLVMVVDDVAGTPTNKKVTLTNLAGSAPFTGAFQPLDADLTSIAAANNGSVLAATTASYTTSQQTVMSTTGVLTGGVLSIGTGGAGVATTFTIASGTGVIVDNTADPSTVTPVTWSAKTDVAVTNIATQLVTFVAIDSGGNVIQSATDFTPAQQRQYIVIGVVVHSGQVTVNAVNQAHVVAYNANSQLGDLMYGVGPFNVSGNVFSSNGANLKLNKSAGSMFRRGANYSSLTENPHIITTGALTQASLRMQNQTGAGSASTTDVDVANYDVGGSTTAISPATRFSILRVFLFQSNLVAVQRGQATYQSLAEAKAAIQTESFVTNDILASNGLLRGFIVAQANATSLADTSKAFFISAGKFGGTAGVGGLSVSTLQNAYDNSSTPEVLTDSTRGALSLKRGSGADTDAVLEILNGAGSTVSTITGEGNVTVVDEAYNATSWNGDLTVPTKNAVRDQFEALRTFEAGVRTTPDTGSAGLISVDVSLSGGIAGGDTLNGGSAASETLTLGSTSHSTRGTVNLRDRTLLISEDKTYNAATGPSLLEVASARTITLSSATNTANGVRAFDFAPTVVWGASAAVSASYLFSNTAIWKSDTTSRSVLALQSFYANPTVRADTGTLTITSIAGATASATLDRINSGTMNVTSFVGFSSGGTVGAGCTVTELTHFYLTDVSNSGTVTTQHGVYIPPLAGATTNIGLFNSSTTVYFTGTSTMSATNSTVRIDRTAVRLNNTSGGSLSLTTSTPCLADGVSAGQIIHLLNTSANDIVFHDESSVAGSNLQLGAATRTVTQYGTLSLMYHSNTGFWHEIGFA